MDDEDSDLNRSCQILFREGYTVLEADCCGRAISVVEDNLDRVDLLVASELRSLSAGMFPDVIFKCCRRLKFGFPSGG